MEPSSNQTPEELLARLELPDRVSIRRWFAFYAVFLLVGCAGLAVLISRAEWNWERWRYDFDRTFQETASGIKLIVFALYLSVCTTFVPLPTGPITAAVAMQRTGVGYGLWDTVLIVALVGAAATTIGNLNDYHLFTWMLRSRRIAAVRHTRVHRAAARWFARRPFLILVIFNVIHIPVDVIRMLAAADRYGRVPFAASNFVGRFIRYGIIAFVTYKWKLDWMPLALLGLGAALGIVSLLPRLKRRIQSRRAKRRAGPAV